MAAYYTRLAEAKEKLARTPEVMAVTARQGVKPKQPPGEPMTLGNMRHLRVHHLVATCLNDACRHQRLIDVSKHPAFPSAD